MNEEVNEHRQNRKTIRFENKAQITEIKAHESLQCERLQHIFGIMNFIYKYASSVFIVQGSCYTCICLNFLNRVEL